jgi:NAD(P)H-hydrate epimerase
MSRHSPSQPNGAIFPELVVTSAEMREIDRLTIEGSGGSGDRLMERAGAGAVEVLRERLGEALRAGVVVVAGKGNNGGDALVMARHLKRRRVRCQVFLSCSPEELSPDAARNYRRWRAIGGKVRELRREGIGALVDAYARCGVVVDGLFGTGLRGTLDEESRTLVEALNASPVPILAVDVPSGLDSDRGVPLGAAVQATVTATFGFPKLGLLIHPGADFAGEVAVVDIGVSPEAVRSVAPKQRWIGPSVLLEAVPPRFPDTHKGTYGHVVILAGSRGKTGAALLAARAAVRAGAGLVTLASPATALLGVVGAAPEVMTEPLEDRNGSWHFSPNDLSGMLRALDGKTAAVFGPGVGVSPATRSLLEWLLANCPVPLVVDADGLNCLAGQIGWLAAARVPVVLTPHPGEMARLLGTSVEEVQADRPAAARKLAERGPVVVLKGARTLVACPDGRLWVNLTGNPGMASGGMGDALSGIIGALLAQGVAAAQAAAAAVFWHGLAADRVAACRGEVGLCASDVIEELPAALASTTAELLEHP